MYRDNAALISHQLHRYFTHVHLLYIDTPPKLKATLEKMYTDHLECCSSAVQARHTGTLCQYRILSDRAKKINTALIAEPCSLYQISLLTTVGNSHRKGHAFPCKKKPACTMGLDHAYYSTYAVVLVNRHESSSFFFLAIYGLTCL